MKKLMQELRKNYHWIVVTMSFLFVFITVGMLNNIHNIYVVPVTEELGVTKASYALTRSLCGVAYFISNAFFVTLYRRFGFRWPSLILTVIAGAVYIFMGTADTMMPFFVGSIILGFAEVFMNTAGISRVITNWFYSHQGKIMGVVMAASGLGGAALTLLINGITETSSWRTSLYVVGIIHFAAAVLLFLLVRDKPEDMGLKPYESVGNGESDAKKNDVKPWKGAGIHVLVRQPFFYLILAYTLLASIGTYGISASINVHMTVRGLSSTQSAFCYSIIMFGLAFAKIIMGAVRDRFGAFTSIMISTCMAIAALVMMLLMNSYAMAIVTALVISVSYCTMGFNQPLLALEMCGTEGYNESLSIIVMCLAAGNIITSPIVNMVYDKLGSYDVVYYVLIGILVVATLLYVLAEKDVKRFKKELENKENG